MSEIIHDIFLSNYWDKRIGNAVLVGIDQINIWIQYFFHNKYKRGYYIRHRIEFFYQRPLKSDKIKFYIADRHNIVHDILLLGKGKISLCGGSIINILNSGTSYVHDYDLFFHCDSIEEANNILNMCMEYVTNLKVKQILYQRSQYIQTIEIIDVTRTWKIQFIRRIYKTKDQILLGFDLSGSRLGWNPQDGLFATICGAMAFAMKAFPIDLTQRSLSFGYRIDKYSKKGFDILLPGLINQNNIETPDGSLIYDEHHKFAFRCEKTKGSDYDDNICGNWYLINMGKYDNVTFSAEKLQDISKFPQEIINSSIKTEPLCELAINTSLIDPYKAQEFLG